LKQLVVDQALRIFAEQEIEMVEPQIRDFVYPKFVSGLQALVQIERILKPSQAEPEGITGSGFLQVWW
jgi:hypothetical protein